MTGTMTQMNVRKLAEQTYVIDVNGEINARSENALMDAYAQVNRDQVRNIVLNFSNLEYMNSSGIGLLVTLLIRVQRQNQRLLACGLNSHYRQIFELTRLDEAISIHEDEDEVIAALDIG